MKGGELPLVDRIMLRKCAVIESVNDELKNICQIEHTRHRSFTNFITNLIAGLLAYSFLPKKPSINVELINQNQLMLCLILYRTHVNLGYKLVDPTRTRCGRLFVETCSLTTLPASHKQSDRTKG